MAAMFQTTYTRRELRRRLGRTVLTASGLAAGVGLVIGITGVSQGLDDAQNTVLSPLKSVGTDVLVTRVVGATDSSSSSTTPTTAAQQGSGGGPRGFFGGPGAQAINQQDIQALQAENSSVVTDLSKLGKPGDKFTHDFFLPGTLLSFDSAALDAVNKIPGVESAVAGLSLQATHQTGTVPQIVAQIQTGGDTVEQNVQPTPEQRQQLRDCVEKAGGFTRRDNGGGGTNDGGGNVVVGPGPGDGSAPPAPNPAAEACFEKFGNFRARFTNPLRTIQQAVNPPQTDITSTPYTAAGVDPAHPDSGLVTRAQLTTGRWLAAGAKDEILLSTAYANKQKLSVGSTVPINGTDYKVVGLVNPALQGNTADVYLPLAVLQELSGKAGRVNELLVKAKDSKSVDKVAAAIKASLPGAQVVTTKALADQVTGSLADAKKLSDRLGGALSVIVLVAAFIIASLLTLSSVAKRVREIGTLRAVGWSKRMVVRQVLMETIGIGFVGAALGVLVGLGALAAVGKFSPEFTASRPALVASSSLGQFFGQAANAAQAATKVKLHAPVRASNLLLGVAFAALGGLFAGTLGGWRAARLQPAEALRDLG
jgi:ABC-type antimicrobial peptide transport system permease subunit